MKRLRSILPRRVFTFGFSGLEQDILTQPTSQLPIGVFDSGVGGLTVLRALREQLPAESLLYLGDTARLPYGTKSAGTVARYAIQAAGHLVDRGIKLLVVACNTASALALDDLVAAFSEIPLLGVVEPGAEAACRQSRAGRIVVLATESTAKNGAYERAIRERRPDADVVSKGCSVFVALAEEGWTHGAVAEMVAHEYMDDVLKEHRPDCVVLGCTHFPVLADVIQRVAGEGVALVDSAATTAAAVRRELAARGIATPAGGAGETKLFATDSPERFHRVAHRFLPTGLVPEHVELVDLSR
jgi:glutamate racemase